MQQDYVTRPSQFNKSLIMTEKEENDKKERIHNSVTLFLNDPEKTELTIDDALHYFQKVIVSFILSETRNSQTLN